ncbi:GNAT family N-acetyltransferase [Streptomyces albus]|uniref:GNAT family N-acetyltransferase n=1 Tax=Streptomyces albus TaxID=1888 RepID=UPI0033DD2115
MRSDRNAQQYFPESSGAAATVYTFMRDGRTVEIRPSTPADLERVTRFYSRLSEESLRQRFFGLGPGLGKEAARRICCRLPERALALVALDRGTVIGVAEYFPTEEPSAAEIAVTVADTHQHRGVGTLLVEQLVDAARTEGITVFTADALTGNRAVARLFTDLGLPVEHRFGADEVHCLVHLGLDQRYTDARAARSRSADVASLGPLLRPQTIAVVTGAGATGKHTGQTLSALRSSGFTGDIVPVDPGAAVNASPSGGPDAPPLPAADLAVLDVPAAGLVRAAEACGERGVRALVVLNRRCGAQRAAALVAVCRRYGMRLVGPGSQGLFVSETSVRFAACGTSAGPRVPEGSGSVGVAVQSGRAGQETCEALERLGMGAAAFVDLGDKLDVSGNDVLQWWEADADVRFVVLRLQSFGNPRAFSRIARRAARSMPLLAVVDTWQAPDGNADDVPGGAPARLPASSRGELFRQAGVTAVGGTGELADTTAIMAAQCLPSAGRVALVANTEEMASRVAVECAEAGLPVRNRSVVPSADDCVRRCCELLAGPRAPDVIMVVATTQPSAEDTYRILRQIRATAPGCHTLVGIVPGQPTRVQLLPDAGEGAVPVFAHAGEAARAVARARERATWLSRSPAAVPDPADMDCSGALKLAREFLSTHARGGWLTEQQCSALLRCAGLGIASPSPPDSAETQLTTGVVMDEVFGPVAFLHPGDADLHAVERTETRLLPLTERDAQEMATAWTGTAGLRDASRSRDRSVLPDVLLRLSALAQLLPEAAQLRVMAGADAAGAVALREAAVCLLPEGLRVP